MNHLKSVSKSKSFRPSLTINELLEIKQALEKTSPTSGALAKINIFLYKIHIGEATPTNSTYYNMKEQVKNNEQDDLEAAERSIRELQKKVNTGEIVIDSSDL